MKNHLALLLVVSLAGLVHIHCEVTTEVPSYEIERKIADSVDKFSTDLLHEGIRKIGNDNNLFISPYSVYSALDLLLAATEGTSREEVVHSLHIRRLLDSVPISEVYKHLAKWQRRQLSEVQSGDRSNVILSLANRIFVDKKVQLKTKFIDLLESYYQSKVIKLPFRDNADESRQKINAWVADKTQNKIRDLLQSDDVNDRTRMVLVNAVYFKGEWETTFDKSRTKDSDFHCLSSGESKVSSVPTMRLESRRFKYGIHEETNVRSLWLPFSDRKTHAVILLPKEKDGLIKLEQRLRTDSKSLMNILKEITHNDVLVNVYLPRLKLESRVDLKPILSSPRFNLKDIFDPQKANFNAMLESKDDKFYLSKAIHKAIFEVDEKGATAAASTGLVMSGLSMPMHVEPPIEFKVDRPFVIVVVNEQKTPLFIGRVVCVGQ